MIDVKLTASGIELELYVDSYEFPGFNTGRDANALTCEIELDSNANAWTSTPLTCWPTARPNTPPRRTPTRHP